MSRITLLSGASAGYFRNLVQFVLSVERTQARGSFTGIVADLGLADEQRRYFARRFADWRLEQFDFKAHPRHVQIRPRLLNTNAWKPVFIRAQLAASPAPVLWFDSATVLLRPLDSALAHVERTGLYTPFGGASTVADLTHPGTLAALQAPPWIGDQRQRASGVFGASPSSAVARELVAAWAEACLRERVVIPVDADHRNHRFDQSVLNALLYPLARRAGVELTGDEIDVSSANPSPLYRTRNKLPAGFPIALDPLARAWFAAYRCVDVSLHRLSRRAGAGKATGAAVQAAQRATGRSRQ